MQPQLMSKSEFASHMGVTRFAVSKWLERGTITDAALVGEGRKAKINVAVAIDQVRRNRDIGQSMGNGVGTRTAQEPEPGPAGPGHEDPVVPEQSAAAGLILQGSDPRATVVSAPVKPRVDTVEDQLKRAKLEEQLRRNRLQASDEAVRQGKLMQADDARNQMAGIAGMMLQIFEGALPDLASALAARFDLPSRDALHLLRAEFNRIRKTAEIKERALATGEAKDVPATVELDS